MLPQRYVFEVSPTLHKSCYFSWDKDRAVKHVQHVAFTKGSVDVTADAVRQPGTLQSICTIGSCFLCSSAITHGKPPCYICQPLRCIVDPTTRADWFTDSSLVGVREYQLSRLRSWDFV